MAKFNVVQKARRAEAAEWKRAMHGDPFTGKLRQRQPPHSVSGKRKRKLLKKLRRDQKEAVDKGLITMGDIHMIAADGTNASLDTAKTVPKFHLRKMKDLKLKPRGKSMKKKKKKKPETPNVDSMIE